MAKVVWTGNADVCALYVDGALTYVENHPNVVDILRRLEGKTIDSFVEKYVDEDWFYGGADYEYPLMEHDVHWMQED